MGSRAGNPDWRKKALGSADKGIAALEKSKQFVRSAGNADPDGLANGAGRAAGGSEPQRFMGAKIGAIVTAVDLQRLRKPSGTSREIEQLGCLTVPLHKLNALERFERANQNRGSGFGGLAHDVEHEVRAIVEENVDVARGQVHRANSGSGSAKMMPRGIAGRIRFGFDNAAADAPSRQFVNHNFPDQEARELDSI